MSVVKWRHLRRTVGFARGFFDERKLRRATLAWDRAGTPRLASQARARSAVTSASICCGVVNKAGVTRTHDPAATPVR